jgi:predicted phage baseplate assembly protein
MAVLTQSEKLPLADAPLSDPVEGDALVLDQRLPDLPALRTLIFSGKRLRAGVKQGVEIVAADGVSKVSLQPGDSLLLEETPASLADGGESWKLTDKNGFTGTVTFDSSDEANSALERIPSEAGDAAVSEVAVVQEVIAGSDPTEILLTAPLLRTYDRPTVTIFANVAAATHGETRREVLGSGDAAASFQRFTLKQKPLTYVSAATTSGAATTLQVRVNDVLWEEAASLYSLPGRERAYVARLDDDGNVTLTFGDGVTGARLPTGNENVVATYRTGIGVEGMVKAGQLSLLMTRPLGVQKVSNPLAPSGAADPEPRDQARQNAPFTVLTLDRIVSLRDFEDFARAFAGIGKAQADSLWDGERRLVYLTIAAATSNGVDHTIDPQSALFTNLAAAMDGARDTVQPLAIASYEPIFFQLKARVVIDPAYIAGDVLDAVKSALQDAYAFEQRAFGQPVHKSEVLAAIQAVEGVTAVFLDQLYLRGQTPGPQTRLLASRARCDKPEEAHDATCAPAQRKPAQLLLLDPNGIDVTEVKP